MIAATAFIAALLGQYAGADVRLLAQAGRSEVWRVVDHENAVTCYVVPQVRCVGDCAYGPAISCVPRMNVQE